MHLPASLSLHFREHEGQPAKQSAFPTMHKLSMPHAVCTPYALHQLRRSACHACSFVTMDWVPERVRIWVDVHDIVREPEPQRG